MLIAANKTPNNTKAGEESAVAFHWKFLDFATAAIHQIKYNTYFFCDLQLHNHNASGKHCSDIACKNELLEASAYKDIFREALLVMRNSPSISQYRHRNTLKGKFSFCMQV